MTNEQFNQVVEERKKKISDVLLKKASDYARALDRLHNFKRASDFARKSPTTIAWQFNLKHLTSIADIVDDLEQSKRPTLAMVDEKIGDAINYLILLEALILEGQRRS